jgi:hypothetical protein
MKFGISSGNIYCDIGKKNHQKHLENKAKKEKDKSSTKDVDRKNALVPLVIVKVEGQPP